MTTRKPLSEVRPGDVVLVEGCEHRVIRVGVIPVSETKSSIVLAFGNDIGTIGRSADTIEVRTADEPLDLPARHGRRAE